METHEDDRVKKEGRVQEGLIRITHRYFGIIFRQLAGYRVYPGQVPVLMLVVKKEGLSQSEISKELHIRPSTVAVSMKRMEKSGLIVRKPDQKDQRIQRIYGTEKLQAMYQELEALCRRNEAILMEGFSESEICLLNRFFDQMYENLGKLPVLDMECHMKEEELEHV